MNSNDIGIESLLQKYAEAAAKHGSATNSGDHETANDQYEVLASICRELRSRGRGAQVHLLDLLDDPNPSVRLWAASHSLEFAPEVAESALEKLMHSRGVEAFDAEMTLGEWRRGTLGFP